jgi:purine-binding chemotaxis protein CheW
MAIDNKDGGTQYLTFLLDGKLFAFDVLKTREVLSLIPITPIPGTPSYMTGVLNLRGSVVPVMDLRKKFGLAEAKYTENTSIVIVEANAGNETVVVGALVDAVKGVRRFEESDLEPPPKVGMRLNLDLIYAIGKTEKDFVLILNVDKVLSDEDFSIAKDIVENAEAGEEAGAKG